MSFESSAGLGVNNQYGPRELVGKFGSAIMTRGNVKELTYTYSYDDVPSSSNSMAVEVPAYAKVIKVYTEVITAVTLGGDRTGASVQAVIGDYDSGADALGAIARGTVIAHSPSTDPVDVGSSAAKLAVTLTATGGASGDLTGGVFRTIVQYIDEGVNNA